ncbi:MAG: ribonuclease III [bacterium]
MADIKDLQIKLGFPFKNIDLLQQALVHRSYINEHPDFKFDHNERLEFLGDAVLELVVTEYLYKNHDNPEGELTNWRAALVNTKMLSQKSAELGVNDYLFLSKGESKDNGRAREMILANTFEAIIGAYYLDQGYVVAEKFITNTVLAELPNVLANELYRDPKSNLQEIIQESVGVTPHYKVLEEEGPDHDKKFLVGVFVDKKEIGRGEGSNKQEAQIEAAKQALEEEKWLK